MGKLTDIFNEMDSNCDGAVSRDEFVSGLINNVSVMEYLDIY